MLHCIQIFTNTCIVTMQVKRDVLHILPIYYGYMYMCLCWVSTLFGLIYLFSTTRFRSLYIPCYLRCKCSTFLYALTPHNAMICPLQWQRNHSWTVFGFNTIVTKVNYHVIQIYFIYTFDIYFLQYRWLQYFLQNI